eukprot:5907844-Amphidinium_carterae.1
MVACTRTPNAGVRLSHTICWNCSEDRALPTMGQKLFAAQYLAHLVGGLLCQKGRSHGSGKSGRAL